ncbi:MAG: response regulator [Chitinophagaceae bacterium]|nr:MAG: response regulator [Chitinophagaceae bacterium]
MTELKPTILLVEDDYLDRMSVERELRKINVHNPLFVARNGREALSMLKGEGVQKLNPKPSVVMLDINMPTMTGFEFLAHIRQDPELQDLKVFIMTTSNDDVDRDLAKEYNVSGYIVKPLTFDKFGKEGADIDGFNLFLELLQLK